MDKRTLHLSPADLMVIHSGLNAIRNSVGTHGSDKSLEEQEQIFELQRKLGHQQGDFELSLDESHILLGDLERYRAILTDLPDPRKGEELDMLISVLKAPPGGRVVRED